MFGNFDGKPQPWQLVFLAIGSIVAIIAAAALPGAIGSTWSSIGLIVIGVFAMLLALSGFVEMHRE